MVSVTGICGTLVTLCATTINNVPTEEVVAQISYENVDYNEQIVEMMGEGSILYSSRDLLSPEEIQKVQEYIEYQEEQERLAELERQRIEEEQRKAMEYPYKNYRQTYYSVQEGERSLGAGYTINSPEIKVIDNVMNFYDEEYGYLPIIAINIDEVLASGLNGRGTPNTYGSVVEIKYPDDSIQQAIILDACGACSWDSRIDLWVWSNDISMDVSGVEFKYLRNGW